MKPPIAELGPHPESRAPVRVLDGRFGPYVTDGVLNASVPRGVDPDTVTLGQAVELLRERAARAPAGGRGRPAKRTAAKKPARRTTAKRTTAKKSATKSTTKKSAATKATKGSAPEASP